jgi:hypothetical protein
MSRSLVELGQHWLLPGLDGVPADTALGLAVADSLHRRHVAPLPPEAGLFVLAPLRARLLRAAPATGGASFAQQWAQAQLPDQALSSVVRRVTRLRGPVVRRVGRTGPIARIDVLDRMGPISRIGRELTPPAGPLTFEAGGASLPTPQNLSWAQVTADAVDGAPPRPGFVIGPTPAPTPGPRPLPPFPFPGGVLDAGRRRPGTATRASTPFALRRPRDPDDPFPEPEDPVDPDPEPDPDPVDPRPPRRDSAAAALFRAAAKRHLALFLATAPPQSGSFGTLGAEAIFAEALALTTPARTFAARVTGLLEEPVPADPASPADAVPSLLFAPRFDAPMSRSLVELGQHWLLPGLDGVPADTALGLRTNGEFVEAFMVGLNHELGRELLWREYPTPMTATFFDRFWDAAVDPEAPPDVAPLDSWADRALGAPTVVEDRFVLLLRSELI